MACNKFSRRMVGYRTEHREREKEREKEKEKKREREKERKREVSLTSVGTTRTPG